MPSEDIGRTVGYFGQFGTDRVIESYFPPGFVGNCIEVGAIDGVFLSNTARFELLGWNCLCIEPQGGEGYFADLAKNRRLAIQCAISAVNANDAVFHVVFCDGKPWSAMSGLLLDERLVEQHRQQGVEIRVETTRVPTRRLDWCIERYFNHPRIDFMSIDVEGSELDVLRSFDVRAYGTRLYVIENNFENPLIPEFMLAQGYVRDLRMEVNDFYIPRASDSRRRPSSSAPDSTRVLGGRGQTVMHGSDAAVGHDPFVQRRIEMTAACRDCDPLPKHPHAGRVIDWRGHRVQVMHDGTKVLAGGYYGSWMQEIIERLKGHHEPQEELVFHALLPRMRPGSLMIEVGSFWAYYTNWFLGAVPHARAICVEPDLNYLLCGQTNLSLNDRRAEMHEACVGGRAADSVLFRRESDGREVFIPQHDWAKLVEIAGGGFVELLHVDVQGAELALLDSLPEKECGKQVRFVMVSTHHASIAGSATTHRDCLLRLIRLGASILCEHSVAESFSGDGLIVASFDTDDTRFPLPCFRRNDPRGSLFGQAAAPAPRVMASGIGPSQVELAIRPAEQPVLCPTSWGHVWTMPSDQVIGAALRNQGTFEEKVIDDVVGFLVRRHAFRPDRIVDIGANVGTHLIYGLVKGLFRRGVGVEADPLNYELLCRNIRQNGLSDRAKTLHFALSDRTGVVTLELSPNNLGDHRVRSAEAHIGPDRYQEAARRTLQLVAETLDTLDAEFQLGIDAGTLMWVDTQGLEGHVLRGARGLVVRRQLRFVVVELWPYGLERSGGRAHLFDFLEACSEVRDLGLPGWESGPALSVAALHARYRELLATPDCRHTDLLCVV